MVKRVKKTINVNDAAVDMYLTKFANTIGAVNLELNSFFKEGVVKSGSGARKYLQELKKICQELRIVIQEKKSQLKEKK